MLDIGRTWQKGQTLTADDLNRIFEDFRRAMGITLGPGLQGAWGKSGIAMGLAAERSDFLVWARVTRIYGADPDLQSNVFYDAKGIFESAAILTNVAPACGRPVKASQASITRIRPASLNALCFIARNRQTNGTVRPELWFPGLGGDYAGLSVKKCGASSDPTPTPEPEPGPGSIGGDEDQALEPGGFVLERMAARVQQLLRR